MIADLKPYPKMKDPGVSWLGKVPEHWEVLPNRAIFMEVKERNHPEEQMLSITINKGVIHQKTLLTDSSKKDSSNQDKTAYKLVHHGDIAYNKMRAWQGALGASIFRGIISPAYVVMRPRVKANFWFYHYLYRTPAFTKEAEQWSYGITSDMWSLRPEHFKMIYTVLPTPNEQAAIVRFLDHAKRKIDRFIRAKKKLIGLLNEQKQAIINHVVTRGLNSDVPLKPSGIQWLEEIPAHWNAWRIGRFAIVGNGSTPSRGKPEYWTGGSYPWLNSSQVNRGLIDNADQFVTPLALQECHLPKVPAGSVLVAITVQGKTRGMAALLAFESTINQHIAYIAVRRSVILPAFLHISLIAAYSTLRALSEDSGSTKGALTCEDLKRFKLPVPPMKEQEQLIEAIERETSITITAIDRTEREISLIQEYRTRLTADIVTGKLDVREAAAKLPEEIEEPETVDESESLEEEDIEVEDLE
jgi:type I restriction enzyme, S subunit